VRIGDNKARALPRRPEGGVDKCKRRVLRGHKTALDIFFSAGTVPERFA
jgi:hypothetical protein